MAGQKVRRREDPRTASYLLHWRHFEIKIRFLSTTGIATLRVKLVPRASQDLVARKLPHTFQSTACINSRMRCSIPSPPSTASHALSRACVCDRRHQTPLSMAAIECNDLWFSYEVAKNISSEAKVDIDVAGYGRAKKAQEKAARTADGGLSVENPRMQYDAGTEIVYKLQLAGVNMSLPVGGRCMLVGAN